MTVARFEFTTTPIAGLVVVQRQRLEDSRGFLSRFYCAEEFGHAGMSQPIVQINHTLTRRRGAVRGMHFQLPPHADMKLVSCVRGEIWDVAVDLRAGAPGFLRWHATILSATNHRSLLIPEGCAHGFQALTDDCELIYLHTAAHRPDAEGAVNASDPRIAVDWPLEISELSDRDRHHAMLDDQFQGFRV